MSEPIYLYDKNGKEVVLYAPSEAERLVTSGELSLEKPVQKPKPKPKPRARKTNA